MSPDGNHGAAETADEILAALERELRQRPTLRPGVLQEFAANIDPSIAALDPRQFHAEYVLPAQRRITRSRTARRTRPRAKAAAPPARQPRAERLPTPSPPVTSSDAVAAIVEPPARNAARPRARRVTPIPAQPGTAARPVASAASTVDRRAVRSAFLDWARTLAEAETATQLVGAVSGVDVFVERALDAVTPPRNERSSSPQ